MATHLATSTAQPSSTRPPRPDTPERWETAARRALARRVSVRQVVGSGQWIASSTTDPTAAYAVTPTECECDAGRAGDPVCQHRALLRMILGLLTVPAEPEPEPPAPTVAAVIVRAAEEKCADCRGDGWWYGSERDTRYTVITCGTCRGTGVDPHTLIAV